MVIYEYDSWGNVAASEGDQDLGKENRSGYFKPSSSIGDYVAAGVTVLIPGSGIGGALRKRK